MADERASRRDFIKIAAGGTAGLLIGCGLGSETDPGPRAHDGGGSDGGEDAGHVGDSGAPDARPNLDATPECLETEDNILGPFYRAGAPENASLAPAEMPGTRLSITGRVLDLACAPLAGALLDIWQADSNGVYDNAGFTLRGKVRADADGRFAFETIIPGNYLNGAQYRPAHIHVIASAMGVAPLTTQLYFVGDEFNDADPWYVPTLAMTLEDAGNGTKRSSFDFVLVRT